MSWSWRWFLVAAATFAGGVLVGQHWLGSVRYGSADWGTVGDWVGGLGSAAAALAAVWQMGHLIAREKSTEEQLRTSAAMAVTVSGPSRWEGLGDATWRFDVRNASTFPVYCAELSIWLGSTEVGRHVIGSLGAGQIVSLDTEVSSRRDVVRTLKAELKFRDARGVWWFSGPDGARMVDPSSAGRPRSVVRSAIGS